MARKKSFEGGFLQGLQFSARMNEAAYFTMLQKIKETERYKELGYERWDDFCNEEVGISDVTLGKRFETLKSLGPESVKMLSAMGYQWRDIKALEGFLDPEQKKGIKQGIIDVEGKKLHITEENADDAKRMFDLLIERASLAQKAEKLANQKLAGIDKEHAKELKAYEKEIEGLKALLPKDEEDAEWAENFLETIKEAHGQFDIALRTFAFRKEMYGDPVLQAKVIGLHEEMKERIRSFEQDFDTVINADEE